MQSANKMCVALLFGGMSSEHEVSCVSVGNFVRNIDRSKYEVLTVGITKEGRWLYTEATAEQMADGSWEELPGNMACVISPDRADHGMILFTPDGRVEKMHLDVVIPVLHGLWGEDGTVQGLLELAGIAYVGCGVLALERERKQTEPKYAEMCRRFLADCEDFTEEKIAEAGIVRRFSNNSTPEDCFSEIQNFVEQQKKL